MRRFYDHSKKIGSCGGRAPNVAETHPSCLHQYDYWNNALARKLNFSEIKVSGTFPILSNAAEKQETEGLR